MFQVRIDNVSNLCSCYSKFSSLNLNFMRKIARTINRAKVEERMERMEREGGGEYADVIYSHST